MMKMIKTFVGVVMLSVMTGGNSLIINAHNHDVCEKETIENKKQIIRTNNDDMSVIVENDDHEYEIER